MGQLEPCPWCGSEYIVSRHDGNLVAAMCGDCQAQGPLVSDWDKAAEHWGDRAGYFHKVSPNGGSGDE